MTHLLLVALGGAIGASLRHLAGLFCMRVLGHAFPWGTAFVNVTGSLAMGLLIGWLAHRASGTSQELRLFLATGLLGGFTTFSAFSLDFASLWERGETLVAASYAVGSVALSLAAIFFGLWLSRSAFA
ncbi:MAG: fluoride efflux transporter CrcB [Nitratireductor sp.]|nr:fluoride efflux transporter CrcB [Nitratireductor sp.]